MVNKLEILPKIYDEEVEILKEDRFVKYLFTRNDSGFGKILIAEAMRPQYRMSYNLYLLSSVQYTRGWIVSRQNLKMPHYYVRHWNKILILKIFGRMMVKSSHSPGVKMTL